MAGEPKIEADAPAAAVIRFPCMKCGAELEFKPGTDRLTCAHCGFENEIETAPTPIDELDYEDALRRLEGAEETRDAELVRCEACGAEMVRPANVDALACAFCGADMIAAPGSARLLRPRSLLPFHVPAENARNTFRAWVTGLWFAPSDLKRYARSDGRMQGVYLPYWTYDALAESDYTGMRGEHYWVTETYTTTVSGRTVTRTRQVRRTRWYPAAGTVRDRFDDLLVCASRSLPRANVDQLEPWDLGALVPFREEYLAGFRAERYAVGLAEGFGFARRRMEPVIAASIRRDIGGDCQRILSVKTRHHDVTFKLLLLPLWLGAYRFRDHVYRIMVNARTGELQGERPWSAWKIAGAIIGVAAVAALVAVVVLVGR